MSKLDEIRAEVAAMRARGDGPQLAAEGKTLILTGQQHKLTGRHEIAMALTLDALLIDAFPPKRWSNARAAGRPDEAA